MAPGIASSRAYRREGSPYRRLLAWAGCEPGDLARLVREDGVEGALQVLCRQGVFLTLEEFKGRRPVVRGALSFTTGPAELAGIGRGGGIVAQTSGSRNAPTRAMYTLEFVRDLAVDTRLALDAMGGYGWVRAPTRSACAVVRRLTAPVELSRPVARAARPTRPGARGP